MNFNPFAFIPLLISVLPFLLIFFAVILVIYCWKAHVKIKFKSFKGKGFMQNIYCKQASEQCSEKRKFQH